MATRSRVVRVDALRLKSVVEEHAKARLVVAGETANMPRGKGLEHDGPHRARYYFIFRGTLVDELRHYIGSGRKLRRFRWAHRT